VCVKQVLEAFGLSGKVTTEKSREHNSERVKRQELKSGETFKKRKKTKKNTKRTC